MLARRSVIIAVAALSISGVVAPAPAKGPLPFPDGTWHGTAIFTGSIADATGSAKGGANMAFHVTIEQGKVTGGVLTLKGKIDAEAEGLSFEGNMKGSFDLSGKAARILESGVLYLPGHATYAGTTWPVELELPVEGESGLRPELVTCNRIEGEFTAEHAAEVQDLGFDTAFSSSFVALRADGAAKVKKILKDYQHVLDEAFELFTKASKAKDPQTKAALMAQANLLVAFLEQSVNVEIAKLGACDVPPGLEGGVGSLIQQAFAAFLDAMGSDPPADVPTLLELLAMGLQTGAAGAPGGGTASYLSGIEGSIGAGLAGADPQTQLDVLVQAQMYGMAGLAAQAKAAVGP